MRRSQLYFLCGIICQAAFLCAVRDFWAKVVLLVVGVTYMVLSCLKDPSPGNDSK